MRLWHEPFEALSKFTAQPARRYLEEIDMEDLVYRLRKRAEIRRQIPSRRSVQEGKADRLADLLDEAAAEIERLRNQQQLQNQ
jgi:hypothetical protein